MEWSWPGQVSPFSQRKHSRWIQELQKAKRFQSILETDWFELPTYYISEVRGLKHDWDIFCLFSANLFYEKLDGLGYFLLPSREEVCACISMSSSNDHFQVWPSVSISNDDDDLFTYFLINDIRSRNVFSLWSLPLNITRFPPIGHGDVCSTFHILRSL